MRRATFERVFAEYGLPEVIRTDNGVPFSSPHALAGLSKLAVWWMRLGIHLERTRRSHPEDNGAHERMHRTLEAEATRPTRKTADLQQPAFNRFRPIFNEERPHDALDLQPPASLYRPSDRRMPERLEPLSYPESYQTRRVNLHAQVRWRGAHYFVSETPRSQTVGLDIDDGGFWNIYLGPALLVELDDREGVIRRRKRRRRQYPVNEGMALPM